MLARVDLVARSDGRIKGPVIEMTEGTKSHRRELLDQIGDVVHDVPAFLTAPLYRRWHLHWGASPVEVVEALPGDDFLPHAQFYDGAGSVSYGAGDSHIFVVNADGTGLTQLTRGKNEADFPPLGRPTATRSFSLVTRSHHSLS